MLAAVSVLFSFVTIIAFAVLDGYNLKDDPAMRWLRCFRAIRIVRLAGMASDVL